jgi:DNA-binding NtrC family response regulator
MDTTYSGHILVVDDEPSVLGITARLLEAAGFTVTTCSDSTKALDLLGDLEPDLLITDVRMPKVTGTDLARTMRRFAVDIPIIIITGYAEIDVVIEAIRQNVFDVIQKPYNPDELAAAAGRAIRHYRDQKALYNQASMPAAPHVPDTFLVELSQIVGDLQKKLEQLQGAINGAEANQLLLSARVRATNLALAIQNQTLAQSIQSTETE